MTKSIGDDASRTFVPEIVEENVVRPRLLDRLTAAMDEPWTLTLVTASAGAGKTRLLAQWAEAIGSEPDTAVVWLSFQRDDVDLSLLRSALERIDDGRLGETLAKVPRAETDETARSLARALRTTLRRIVIVFDDVHLIGSPELADMLSAFVHAVPGNAHVVLSGRGTRLIRVARRRIAGIALELDNADLAFTPAEVRSLFRASGITVSQGEITTILHRTEGWAAGLRLMVLAGLEHRDATDTPLRGDAPALVDYFLEEVFGDLDEELTEFLLFTSVPEAFSLDLAYRLSPGAPAAALVERLIQLSVLMGRRGVDPVWYHYHPLLREFLAARLRDRGRAVVERLEKDAAEWFAEQEAHLPALRHATQSCDPACMAVILRRCGMQLILTGHACEVTEAIRAMPAPLRADPAVQMLIAAAELARGDASAAATVLATLRDEDGSAVSRQWLTGLDLHTAVRRGGIAQALDRLGRAFDTVTGESQLDTYAFLQAAMGELYVGHLDRAERYARTAADQARAVGAVAAELQASAVLNTSALFRGRMRDVLTAGSRLDARWRELGEPDDAFYEVTRVWRCWVPYERLQAIDAEQTMRAAAAIIDSGSEPAISRGLSGLVALLDTDGAADPRAAASMLLETLVPRDDMPLPPHWYAMVGVFAVHAFDRLGEPNLRDQFIADTERALGTSGEVVVLRAIAALHDHRHAEARETLAPVLDGSTTCALPASLVDAWLVAAALDVHGGDSERAQASLSLALSLAEPEEHVRRIAAADQAVLRLLGARATAGTRTRFADTVRERLVAAGLLVDEQLTHRERIVLLALSRNATLRQIAQQEFISPNTVKTHVRNIYRKLGVSDRDSVTAAAHALGIE
ncbi:MULTISPECIES: LuxR C-terminal-related transcriptional regulator [unclassified Microbacterium]|uniref:LuxR C-terminal-related transcriptional regulator n=1 Tax=unclassified Microbacterium TaxID=2609290 RepID=UPI00109C4F36|nr:MULTISPECIES: LuxR C-terminal-related transcriptional regulator [unclassified Microbacterium]